MHFTTSQQVRQLGRELGVVLLEPNGRNVRLTEAARTLLAHADAIEARWEQAEIDLRSAKDEPAGLLRLCSMPTAVSRAAADTSRRRRRNGRTAACPEPERELAGVTSFEIRPASRAEVVLFETGPPVVGVASFEIGSALAGVTSFETGVVAVEVASFEVGPALATVFCSGADGAVSV